VKVRRALTRGVPVSCSAGRGGLCIVRGFAGGRLVLSGRERLRHSRRVTSGGWFATVLARPTAAGRRLLARSGRRVTVSLRITAAGRRSRATVLLVR
jgi:hypothetical protein